MEKNPGPENEDASDTSFSSTFPYFNGIFSDVQSVQHKLDIIEPEFSNFGLVSLTETWLHNSVLSQDSMIFSYLLGVIV